MTAVKDSAPFLSSLLQTSPKQLSLAWPIPTFIRVNRMNCWKGNTKYARGGNVKGRGRFWGGWFMRPWRQYRSQLRTDTDAMAASILCAFRTRGMRTDLPPERRLPTCYPRDQHSFSLGSGEYILLGKSPI